MANYDDIFNASQPKESEEKSFTPFDKDEWAAQKKQERENAFAMIDETAQHMANDGALFQSYLDVQAHFDRYSVGNALLITAQKPDAKQLADFKGWKDNGVYIKKGESGITLLEPGEEYTKEDGSIGVSYNSKKVFDITQTNAKVKDRPGVKRDERMLLKAIIHNAPCPIETSQQMPENINAVYRSEDKKIYVKAGQEAADIFRGISQELAHAHLDNGDYKRSDHAFTAYCVSYMLCSRYNVAKDMSDQYRFNSDQDEQLDELLNVDNSMWMAVLYGVYGSDDMIVQVALSQIGNVGGEPYWSWYGFGSRVEWCACFVSWCADQCGYIDTGVIPKYAGCDNGMDWFKERGQWADNSVEPSPGMIIFFDWAYNGQNGTADHTGIVERVENGIVYTVEGNTSDSCAERYYAVGHSEILGYGMPAY